MKSGFKVIEGAKPFFAGTIEPMLADIRQTLESGHLTHGPRIEEFEAKFAEFVGTKYALGISSGGSALELVLRAIGVEGKEVIVPTDTFVASVNAVILAGGTPVLADINRDTLCIDFDEIKRKTTARTACVMVVHMFGLVPPEMDQIQAFCKKAGIFLLEDAAHAQGASYKGRAAGALGDAACFSFYASKVMTTGEGGMVTTDDKNLADAVRRLRNHGKSLTVPVFEIPSNNYRLAEIPSIIGKYQLTLLRENVERRNRVAEIYYSKLAGAQGIHLLPKHSPCYHSFWRYPLLLDQAINRLEFQKRLDTEFGVRVTWMYEPLCHLQPVFMQRLGHKKGDLPVAEDCMSRLICLPCYPDLSDEDAQRVCDGVRACALECAK